MLDSFPHRRVLFLGDAALALTLAKHVDNEAALQAAIDVALASVLTHT